MMLSGKVAIVRDGRVTEIRDLGPEPIAVKPGTVLPLTEDRAELGPDEQHGDPIYEIGEKGVRAIYRAEPNPPEPVDPVLERLKALEADVAALKAVRG